jgi:adenylate cyclase
VPRKGYRFIGQVEICEKEDPACSLFSNALPVIAVLPFNLFLRCGEEECFGPGLTDVLVTKLSNLSQINVIPSANTRKYAKVAYDPVEVGKELSVDCVLTGSFQQAGTRIRTTVQLINVESGRVVFSDIIDLDSMDVFSVQDLICERITRSILLLSGGDCNNRIDGTNSGSTNRSNS